MAERVAVTLVIDIPGLMDWALGICPWADPLVSAWRGAALMAKTLSASWDGGFDVAFRPWEGDRVVDLDYPCGDGDLSAADDALLEDVRSRTDIAVFAALEDGLWVTANEPCYGVFTTRPGAAASRALDLTARTREEAGALRTAKVARLERLGLRAASVAWTVEPMPLSRPGERR
jgi:hypothetical protein